LAVPRPLASGDARAADSLGAWIETAAAALESCNRALVYVEPGPLEGADAPEAMTRDLLCAVQHLLERTPLAHLLVEGGSTASALMRKLGWTQLRVTGEIAPGVVSLEVEGDSRRSLTVKPGSYRWPDAVWEI
jgi:uncharacterized protein YgbK (DUF1537 family)